MAEVIIAAGSNLGDRNTYLQKAAEFLEKLSLLPVQKSSVWESEPVGQAEYNFLNTVCMIHTDLSSSDLLFELKDFEYKTGRDINSKKWAPRILDLDIIGYNNLVIQKESLIIPHPEYHKRLFVLLPLQELFPEWKDPKTGIDIKTMINKAPDIIIEKTDFNW